MSGGLPPLGPGAIPPAIRDAGPQAADRYRAALGFERMLLGELLESALPETGAGPHAGALPGALADALVAGGGTGMATELQRAMEASS